MRKAFVAGWPISHSLSPVLHAYWLENHAIEGSYEAVAVEPGRVSQFLSSLSGRYEGGNVTIPHKEAALAACDRLEDVAKAIGAVNTVWLEDGDLVGSNTDSYGFSANLDQLAPEWKAGKTALVLGAGGAARPVVHALIEAGYDRIDIVNRTVEKAENIAVHFAPIARSARLMAGSLDSASTLLSSADIVVNTTSLGMKGNPGLPIDLSGVKAGLIVTDIVYAPLVTPLLAQAADAGLRTVDGLGMLLHQAAPGFEKWFGILPRVDDALRRHVLDALAAREGRK